MKLWGGRFAEGPSEVFERFSGSLHFDRRLFDADIRGSQAFARALARVGVLTDAECDELSALLAFLCRHCEHGRRLSGCGPDSPCHTGAHSRSDRCDGVGSLLRGTGRAWRRRVGDRAIGSN